MTTRTNFNLSLIGDDICGKYDFPIIKKQEIELPTEIIPFNMAKTYKNKNVGIHFYIDDYQFERIWKRPQYYLDLLKQYKCVFSPGYSLFLDMPLSMKIWNSYRRQLLGCFWQRNGIKVIPTILWAESRTFQFCFDGIEPGGIVSVSTLGAAGSRLSREYWRRGATEMMRKLYPNTILHYGLPIPFDFGDAKVIYYDNPIIKRFENGW